MCHIKILLSPIIACNLYNSTLNNVNRLGICQMFYISKITKCFNFTLEKQVNRDIVGNKLRIGDVSLIYFGQVVSFCAIIYPNKNSLNSCMPECGKFQRIGNIFAIILKNFTRAKYILTKWHSWQIPRPNVNVSDSARVGNAVQCHIVIVNHF